MKTTHGFTLIEILVVIGMIAVLASVVLVAVNPSRQFAQARNSQRMSNVHALLNAVGNRVAERRGLFNDTGCQTIPSTATEMSTAGYDIRPCLVPSYIPELPFDPSTGNNSCEDVACTAGTYDTGYTIEQATGTGRVTICAPGAAEPAIEGSKKYCLTR